MTSPEPLSWPRWWLAVAATALLAVCAWRFYSYPPVEPLYEPPSQEYGPWPKPMGYAVWMQIAPTVCRTGSDKIEDEPALFATLAVGECTKRITPALLDFLFRHGTGPLVVNLTGVSSADVERRELLHLGGGRRPLLVVGIGPTGRLRITVQDESFVRVKYVPVRRVVEPR